MITSFIIRYRDVGATPGHYETAAREHVGDSRNSRAGNMAKESGCLVRGRIVIESKRGRESVCTLRPEAIKTVSEWAISYRQFWEESFDKLEVVINQMKKTEVRDDTKHG